MAAVGASVRCRDPRGPALGRWTLGLRPTCDSAAVGACTPTCTDPQGFLSWEGDQVKVTLALGCKWQDWGLGRTADEITAPPASCLPWHPFPPARRCGDGLLCTFFILTRSGSLNSGRGKEREEDCSVPPAAQPPARGVHLPTGLCVQEPRDRPLVPSSTPFGSPKGVPRDWWSALSLLQVPYETLNKRFRAAQKNIDRETSHVTMVVAELEKTLSSCPAVDSVVSLLDGVVEKLSVLKRKVGPGRSRRLCWLAPSLPPALRASGQLPAPCSRGPAVLAPSARAPRQSGWGRGRGGVWNCTQNSMRALSLGMVGGRWHWFAHGDNQRMRCFKRQRTRRRRAPQGDRATGSRGGGLADSDPSPEHCPSGGHPGVVPHRHCSPSLGVAAAEMPGRVSAVLWCEVCVPSPTCWAGTRAPRTGRRQCSEGHPDLRLGSCRHCFAVFKDGGTVESFCRK